MRSSQHTVAPTLRSSRLTLTNPVVGDFEDGVALWTDPAVVRFIGRRALSRGEVWTRLLRHAGL